MDIEDQINLMNALSAQLIHMFDEEKTPTNVVLGVCTITLTSYCANQEIGEKDFEDILNEIRASYKSNVETRNEMLAKK